VVDSFHPLNPSGNKISPAAKLRDSFSYSTAPVEAWQDSHDKNTYNLFR